MGSSFNQVIDALTYVTIVAVVAAMWLRRDAIGVHGQRGRTRSLIYVLTGFILLSPVSSERIGDLVHRGTGLWHIETVVGLAALAYGRVLSLASKLGALLDSWQRRRFLRAWLQVPATITFWASVAAVAFTHSPAISDPNILDARPDGWLDFYWVASLGLMVVVNVGSLRFLWLARAFESDRRVLAGFAALNLVGIAGLATRLVGLLCPTGVCTPDGIASWIALDVWTAGFAAMQVWLWRRARRPAVCVECGASGCETVAG